MKKLGLSVLIVALLVIGANAAGHHFRYDLHAAAINFEREAASLEPYTTQIDGEIVNYYSSAEKPEKIVMLHGFTGSKDNWPRYASHFIDRYQVIVPDLKGHGENKQDLNGSYHVEDQVQFVDALMGAIGVNKFHLVGNSMGGAISMLYAASFPEKTASVTLISPAGVHDVPSEMDTILEGGKNPLIAKTEQQFIEILDFVMSEQPFIPGPISQVEAEKAVARADLNAVIFKQLREDLAAGVNSKINQVNTPTFIIWGEEDRVINAKNIDKYASLVAGAKTLVMSGIGHLAMVEVPSYTADETLKFITQLN
jgi:pimeloyl-ACP methyl ester carboxylesterase